jgi:hypothetical protein
MKNKLNYLLPLLVIVLLTSACLKKTAPVPVVLPVGTFSGPFTVIHLNPRTNKQDTSTANLVLNMSAATGFAVTGDTTKLHAGSHGGYQVDGTYVQFSDQTLPASPPVGVPSVPAKYHLNGLYLYNYDGTNFQFYATSDTLLVVYKLKAQ